MAAARKAQPAGRKLAFHVHVAHPDTGETVVLPAGSVPPLEFADLIGDHAFESGDAESTEDDGADE
jgi:hypothetical protein